MRIEQARGHAELGADRLGRDVIEHLQRRNRPECLAQILGAGKVRRVGLHGIVDGIFQVGRLDVQAVQQCRALFMDDFTHDARPVTHVQDSLLLVQARQQHPEDRIFQMRIQCPVYGQTVPLPPDHIHEEREASVSIHLADDPHFADAGKRWLNLRVLIYDIRKLCVGKAQQDCGMVLFYLHRGRGRGAVEK